MSGVGNTLGTASSTHWNILTIDVNSILNSSISASNQYGATNYEVNNVTGSSYDDENLYRQHLGMPKQQYMYSQAAAHSWLYYRAKVADGDAGEIYVDFDRGTGHREVVNGIVFNGSSNTTYTPGGYHVSASNDDVSNGSDATNWTALTSSFPYPGRSGIAQHNETLIFNNTTAYRWYKFLFKDTSSTYGGMGNIITWDTAKFANGNNLIDPAVTNITGSFISTQNSDLIKLASRAKENYGLYFPQPMGSVTFHWPDAPLFRGFVAEAYTNDNFAPGYIEYWKSDTGENDDWTLIRVSDFNNEMHEPDGIGNSLFLLDIGTPIKTKYLRLIVSEENSSNDTTNLLARNLWAYQMVSASAPPTPTNLVTVAQESNVALTWDQAAGKDNRLSDIIYHIERSDDAGSSYSRISSISGSRVQPAETSSFGFPLDRFFVDTDVADGSYLYRVQSDNQHHFTTSSYVTSDSLTLPVVSTAASKKIYVTNKGNIMINPNDTTLIEL